MTAFTILSMALLYTIFALIVGRIVFKLERHAGTDLETALIVSCLFGLIWPAFVSMAALWWAIKLLFKGAVLFVSYVFSMTDDVLWAFFNIR